MTDMSDSTEDPNTKGKKNFCIMGIRYSEKKKHRRQNPQNWYFGRHERKAYVFLNMHCTMVGLFLIGVLTDLNGSLGAQSVC